MGKEATILNIIPPENSQEGKNTNYVGAYVYVYDCVRIHSVYEWVRMWSYIQRGAKKNI